MASLRTTAARWLARPLFLLMALPGLVALVTGLAYVNAEREAKASFQRFALEQVTLAATVTAALEVSMAHAASATPPSWLAELQAEARILERGQQRRLLLLPAGAGQFHDLRGSQVTAPALVDAAARHQCQVTLPPAAGAALGMPALAAVVGLSTFTAPGCEAAPCLPGVAAASGPWTLAVVATAQRERARELREVRLILLWVLMSAGLLGGVLALALQLQRADHRHAQASAVAAVVAEHDARLSRAERTALLGTLASGIAHEIATPLGVILARAEQLERRVAQDPSAARAVAAIMTQVQDIERVIRGFLGLARGGAPARGQVAPALVVSEALGLCRHRLERAGVALEVQQPADLPLLTGDGHLLRQVLVNLLLNACDAAAGGADEPQVTLRLTADHDGVEFCVTDNGPTIAPDIARRAMEPFFTTKPAGQGTGLGLAIAHEVIKHHSGTLRLGPRPDGRAGTEARVWLPRAGGGPR